MTHRRLLLITYHFGAKGATGGFRWRAMADALAARGWVVDVVTSAPVGATELEAPPHAGTIVRASTPPWGRWVTDAIDRARGIRRQAADSLLAEDRPGTAERTVEPIDPSRVIMWQPPSTRAWLSQAKLAAQDIETILKERAWGQAAMHAARRTASRARPAAVIVSAPPHLHALAAVHLARELGVPSIVDFRDAWVVGKTADQGLNSVGFVQRILRRWEQTVYRSASVILHNTERARSVVTAALGSRRRAQHETVANGYELRAEAAMPDAEVFRVAFTGWIHPVMDVRVILAACGRLRTRHALDSSNFEVTFMGCGPEFGGVPLEGMAMHYGLGDAFKLEPRRSRSDAQSLQERSAVLCAMDLLHPMAVPMKFYDYAQMRGRMLLIGSPQSALCDAAGCLGIPVFNGEDEGNIDAYLDETYSMWREGRLTRPNDPSGIFRRELQTEKLSSILDRLLESSSKPNAGPSPCHVRARGTR